MLFERLMHKIYVYIYFTILHNELELRINFDEYIYLLKWKIEEITNNFSNKNVT